MKRFTSILLILAIVFSVVLLASCSDDAAVSLANSKSYANVNFSNDSKSLGSSIEDLESVGGADALYWTYTATPDKDGAVGAQASEKAVKAEGAGLGTVMGFEVGKWTFKLFAYKEATLETILYESEPISVNLVSGQTASVTFPVRKTMREDQPGTIHILIDKIVFIMDDGSVDPADYELLSVNVNGDSNYVLTSDTGYSAEVVPGTYNLYMEFVHKGYSYLAYLDGINIYSNFETAIKGSVEGKKVASYNIYYHDVGGDDYSGKDGASLPQKHWYGTTDNLPVKGLKDYFTFINWYSDSEGTDVITTVDSEVYEDYHVYAAWCPITYTITYNFNALVDNAEDSTLNTEDVADNPSAYDFTSETITLLNGVTRTGYSFNGWSSGTDATTRTEMQIPSGTAGNLTFNANWREHTYNIHFDSNYASATDFGGRVTSGDMADMEGVLYSETVNLTPNNFTATGWKFKNWVLEDGTAVQGGDQAEVAKLTSTDLATVVLRVNWQRTGDNSYHVQHWFEELDGSYTLDESRTNLIEEVLVGDETDGDDCIVQGLTGFAYSEEVSSQTNHGIIENDNSLVLNLYYPRNKWNLIWDFDGGYPVSEDVFTTAGNYKWEKSLDIPADNQMYKDGYTFDHFEYNGELTPVTNMPDTNLTIKAVWIANPYTVQFTTGNGGGGSTVADGSMADEEFVFDADSQALTANTFTKAGYEFSHWKRTDITTSTTYTNGQDVRNLTTVSNHIVVLEAVWTSNTYIVKFNKNQPESASTTVEGSTDDMECRYDENFNLPDSGYNLEGYTFKGWTLDPENSGELYNTTTDYVNLTSAPNGVVKFYAKWEANKYTVHYDGNEHGNTAHKSRSSVTNLTADTERTFDAPAAMLSQNGFVRTGYTFKGWSTDSNATLENGSFIYTVTDSYDVNFSTGEDVTLYAVWEINKYTVTINVVNKTVAEDGVTKTPVSDVFGKVKNSGVEVTAVAMVEYKEVISTTDFSFYVTSTDGVKIVDGVPETSTTDYAYSFDAWYREDGTTALNGLSVEGNVTVTAVFERRVNPRVDSIVKLDTTVVIDFKSFDLQTYENATLGSVTFSMPYGTRFENLDYDVFAGCTLDGYKIEGLYYGDVCLVSFTGPDAGFVDYDGIIEDGVWVMNGGKITVLAHWAESV